ncbi:MAG: methyltransferase domain-containing protein [Natronomonas sp.]
MYLLEFAGEEDTFSIREAESRCSNVEHLAPGLGTADGVRDVETLAYTRRVCELVGTCHSSIDDAVGILESASFDREGTVAVRARDVRGLASIDTQRAERELGRVLVERGLEVDLDSPDETLLAFFSETAALGWLETESVRDFSDRQPTQKPFFQPGSMDPMDARALANIARAGPDARLLDPMCGTGGILVEAGLAGAAVVGVDAQSKMVRGARRNLGAYLEDEYETLLGDATRLPFVERSREADTTRTDFPFDGIVFDAPYGRQSKIAGRPLEELLESTLVEVRRLAPIAVVVCDRPCNVVAARAGWTIESRFDRRVHRSLTRYVHVLQ